MSLLIKAYFSGNFLYFASILKYFLAHLTNTYSICLRKKAISTHPTSLCVLSCLSIHVATQSSNVLLSSGHFLRYITYLTRTNMVKLWLAIRRNDNLNSSLIIIKLKQELRDLSTLKASP